VNGYPESNRDKHNGMGREKGPTIFLSRKIFGFTPKKPIPTISVHARHLIVNARRWQLFQIIIIKFIVFKKMLAILHLS